VRFYFSPGPDVGNREESINISLLPPEKKRKKKKKKRRRSSNPHLPVKNTHTPLQGQTYIQHLCPDEEISHASHLKPTLPL